MLAKKKVRSSCMCDNPQGSWIVCQQKSSLILKLFYAQLWSLLRSVWRNQRSYDAGRWEFIGFLLVKGWSLERNSKLFIKIFAEL